MLKDEPKREPKLQRGWRLRESLVKYIETRGKDGARGSETKIVEDALALHKSLFERLQASKQRLARYALDEGLDLHDQEAEVFSRLILRGLEDAERRRK